MKRLLLTIVIVFCAGLVADAQQKPHYTQYVVNPFIINPAIAGIDNYVDLKMAVRDQIF